MSKKRVLFLKSLIAILVVAVAATAPLASVSSFAATTKVLITGSSTVAPLMAEIAKKFEDDNGSFRIDVQSGGSTKGVTDTRAGLAQIGMISRDLNSQESDLQAHLLAIDGIAMVAHSTNPIQNLTTEQIKQIYLGQISNWKDVGGNDAKIVVVSKSEGRSTLEMFTQHFSLKPSQIKAHAIIGDNEQGIKMVSGNPNAIAYVSIGSSEAAVKNGSRIKLLKMDQMMPSSEMIRTGKYPLIRRLNLVTLAKPAAEILRIVEFAQSAKVQPIVDSLYFVRADVTLTGNPPPKRVR